MYGCIGAVVACPVKFSSGRWGERKFDIRAEGCNEVVWGC